VYQSTDTLFHFYSHDIFVKLFSILTDYILDTIYCLVSIVWS